MTDTLIAETTTTSDLPDTPEIPDAPVDEYAEVVHMLHVLRQLPAESHEFRRQLDDVIAMCLPLADHVAAHFDRRGENLEDLIQVARLGLMNAVRRFDPDKGSSFVAFAVPTMMGEVRRYFRDHGWSMHVPRRIRDRHVQLSRATTHLTQTLGRAPTPGELAAELGVDREEIVESLIAADAYRVQSIDAPIGSGDDSSPRTVADNIGSVDARIDFITDREAVRPLLAALPERERSVLNMRFFESMTQSQIADAIGVSQMHVSRILERTLRQLRDQLR